jgi:hypothetical protein
VLSTVDLKKNATKTKKAGTETRKRLNLNGQKLKK